MEEQDWIPIVVEATEEPMFVAYIDKTNQIARLHILQEFGGCGTYERTQLRREATTWTEAGSFRQVQQFAHEHDVTVILCRQC